MPNALCLREPLFSRTVLIQEYHISSRQINRMSCTKTGHYIYILNVSSPDQSLTALSICKAEKSILRPPPTTITLGAIIANRHLKGRELCSNSKNRKCLFVVRRGESERAPSKKKRKKKKYDNDEHAENGVEKEGGDRINEGNEADDVLPT